MVIAMGFQALLKPHVPYLIWLYMYMYFVYVCANPEPWWIIVNNTVGGKARSTTVSEAEVQFSKFEFYTVIHIYIYISTVYLFWKDPRFKRSCKE